MSGAGDVIAPGPSRSPMLSVSIAGAGTARFDDLNADVLRFDISGAGEGQLTGQVQSLNLSVSGKGKVTADQLRVSTASVSISGVGNAELVGDRHAARRHLRRRPCRLLGPAEGAAVDLGARLRGSARREALSPPRPAPHA